MFSWSSAITGIVVACSCTYRTFSEACDQDPEVCPEVLDEAQKEDRVNLLQSLRVNVERFAAEEADDYIGSYPSPLSQGLSAAIYETEARLSEVNNASNVPKPAFSLTEIAGSVRRLVFASSSNTVFVAILLFVCTAIGCFCIFFIMLAVEEKRNRDAADEAPMRIPRERSQFPAPVRRSPPVVGMATRSASPARAAPVSHSPPPRHPQTSAQGSRLEANPYSNAQLAPQSVAMAEAVAARLSPPATPYPPLMSAAVMPQQPAPPSTVDLAGMPSPICPSLVLPVCESRFAIPMSEIHAIEGGEGTLNIGGGLSGNALLRAYVRLGSDGRRVEIATPEPGAVVRASIGHSASGSEEHPGVSASNLLDIRGLRGAYYGLLEICSSGPCIVTRQGQQLMTIDGDPDELKLWITSVGDKHLASGRCCKEPFGGVDHVDIRVQPGMDTVLALACILAVLLFCRN